jgi:membrane-bound lytic murein transglycosylase D
MNYRKLQLFCYLVFVPVILFAQDIIRSDSSAKKRTFVEDDPVVAMLDSLATLKVFENSSFLNPPSNQFPQGNIDKQIPVFSDSLIRERITGMSEQSPFEYVYNADVKKFIDLYAYRKRGLTERILGLSQIYFPLFEEQLDKYNMPLELKYLAVIESALNPIANSRAGAKGLWQFMYGTGKVYGLKITSYVDDRFDPIKSTIAACEHLTDLYDIYGNWSLALAAYNSGAGNVNKAIRRAGGAKNFWVIQRYLPKETRSYVPAFIAASYVLTYAQENRITPVDPGILFYEFDTVTVFNPLTFGQISEMLHIPYEEIQFLNPAYKQGVIPATHESPYKLRLRKKYIGDFINNESLLYTYRTHKGIEHDSLLALAYLSNRETSEYMVKKGETIGSIAKRFHMSVGDLKALNGLTKNYVKPKKRLLVYVGAPKGKIPDNYAYLGNPPAETSGKPVKGATNTKESSSTEWHTVASGESLGKISKQYDCSVDDLMKWNNLNSSAIIIGQKLKVSASPAVSTASTDSSRSHPPKTSFSSSSKYIWYTIKMGDNLWDIAEKYDVTVSQIKSLNDIKNTNRLKAGEKIKIPK